MTGHFFAAADRFPDRLAIVDGEEEITYARLREMVRRTATYFSAKGIKKGDRVLVFLPMGIDLYRVVLGLFRIGAVAVFLDEWVSIERLRLSCRIAGCRGFIGIRKARLLALFFPELRNIPVKLRVRGWEHQSGESVHTDSFKEDAALITFTTGSTGMPKAAVRTHGHLNEQFIALRGLIRPGENDVVVTLLPIVLLINLGVGSTSVIVPFSAKKPQNTRFRTVAQTIARLNVSRIIASPFFVSSLGSYVLAKGISFPQVKQVFTGGAPVFPREAALIRSAFDGADVQIVYGSTEAEPISSVPASVVAGMVQVEKGLPVGQVHRSCSVKIIPIQNGPVGPFGAETDLMTCAAGETGEIVVAGPHVLNGYLHDKEAFRRNKIVAGDLIYHRTGDSGFLDNKGELFLAGRCSSVFEAAGSVIYPFLYEAVFQTWPGVKRGTILSIKGNVKAVFEMHDRSRRDMVGDRCKGLPFRVDEVVFLKKMPRDPRHFSKIDYERLKVMIAPGLPRRQA